MFCAPMMLIAELAPGLSGCCVQSPTSEIPEFCQRLENHPVRKYNVSRGAVSITDVPCIYLRLRRNQRLPYTYSSDQNSFPDPVPENERNASPEALCGKSNFAFHTSENAPAVNATRKVKSKRRIHIPNPTRFFRCITQTNFSNAPNEICVFIIEH